MRMCDRNAVRGVSLLFASLAILAVLGAVACHGRDDARNHASAPPDTAASADVVAEADRPSPLLASALPPSATPDPHAAAEPDREDLVVVAGGDVSFGRALGQRLLRDPGLDPLRRVAPWFAAGDIAFVNLESQLSDQRGETQSPDLKLKFVGPPAGADALARAHIGLVSLANNHIWDYGARAFEETLDNLTRAGVRYAGVARTAGQQYEPVVLTGAGSSVAFFAVTNIWNAGRFAGHPGSHHVAWADPGALVPRIAAARRAHDFVVVSYHGDVEYADTPYPPTRDFVTAVMRAGADAVLGHHPHVPRALEWFGGRPALYGLGNLLFDKRTSDKPWERVSFVARLTFARARATTLASSPPAPAVKLEACPYRLGADDEPRPLAPDDPTAEALRAHLEAISRAVGSIRTGTRAADGCFPILPPTGVRADQPGH